MIGISTEHNYTTGSEQWQWLADDLAGVDRSKTPWVIFGGHRAMYINSDYDTGAYVPCPTNNNCSTPLVPGTSDIAVMNLLIEHVEPLLYKYKVDVGFYGHNHVRN